MTTAIATVNPVSTDHRPTDHRIVSRQQWLAERKALLEREKELTHLRDQIARERRALPWVRMDKDYVFDTPQGPRRLADLFDGRRQLVMQHFMLAPGWEQGCKSCSYMADHTDAHARAPGGARHQLRRRLAGAARRDRALPPAHGLEVPLGVLARHRLQPRLPRHLHARGEGERHARLQFRRQAARPGAARRQRLLEGRRGRGLPHLLDLRPRRGGDDAHLQPARPHAQGPRRGRARLHHGLGAPP